MDILPARNSHNIEIFVKNHILPGTTIVTDGWAGYNFLDNEESVWPHEIYNHGAGNFGIGAHSTSNIEQTWGHIKNMIKNIYNIIPKDNYRYFIRECEFRLNICKKNNKDKLEIFKKILKNVYILNNFNFYEQDEILAFDNYDI